MTVAQRLVRTALLEYYVTDETTLLLLIHAGAERPVVFTATRPNDGAPLTAADIRTYMTRLAVDFNGLPNGWDQGDNANPYQQVLALSPSVHAAKRSQPMRMQTLANPRFHYELTYLNELSQALLPSALQEQLAEVDLLCIIPHGPLHLLPFAALRWSDNTYLLERFGVCQAPSLSILRHCHARNRRRLDPAYQPTNCLIAAVAAADDRDPEFFEKDGQTLHGLFSKRKERGQVKALIGALASGDTLPATKVNVLEALPSCDVVHFACHGVFGMDGSEGETTGLLVSSGGPMCRLRELPHLPRKEAAACLIAPTDILARQMHANLVTLRACSSGRVNVRLGDELMGITRAFLYAGTASLIVSLWDVNKRSSQVLLDTFYERWVGDRHLVKWQALREAQLAMLRTNEYAHPYHWAAMQLIGDWL